MSLRVLLADESASIRKVFQMGLQDFGAEVKSVHSGLDVIEVAEKYQPQIIFADILLQKKNGYEVTSELNQHPQLSEIPVVLMWSSFMELDRKQFQACGAQGELEKPFDVEKMRGIIKSLVESTKSQQISSFLNFPTSITQTFFEEEEHKKQANLSPEPEPQPPSTKPNEPNQPSFTEPSEAELEMEFSLEEGPIEEESEQEIEASSVFNTQAETDDDEFDMYEVTATGEPLNKKPKQRQEEPRPLHQNQGTQNEDQWQARPLSPSKPENTALTNDDSDMDQFQSMDLRNDKKINLSDFLYQPNTKEQNKELTATNQQIQNVRVPVYEDTVVNADVVSPAEKEAIIRSEVRSWLMTNMKQELPSMLEKVVREELNKILEQEMALKGTGPQT